MMPDNDWADHLDGMLEDVLEKENDREAEALAPALRRFFDSAIKTAEREFTGESRGRECSRYLSMAADRVVRGLTESLQNDLPTCSFLAAGGYGRGMLSPGSSVRTLVLVDCADPDRIRDLEEEVAALFGEALPRTSVRVFTIDDAIHFMSSDALEGTNLLETRFLAGSSEIYKRFRRSVTEDFLRPGWGRFVEEVLEESLAHRDPYTSSPYRTEFNLKENAGALRDIGTLKKISEALLQIPALERFWRDMGGEQHGILTDDERQHLDRALGLLLTIRNELQFTAGEDSDVLEMRVQPAVARNLGYLQEEGNTEEAVGRMMHDIFSHAGRVANMTSAVEERFTHIHSVAWSGKAGPQRRRLESDFVEVDEKIYNAASPPFQAGPGARRMLEAFLLSQRRHIEVGHELLEQVGRHLHLVDETFRCDRPAAEIFMDLLAGSVGVARRLSWMRDCGLLQTYIPEFKPFVHQVNYAESRDYTLDEHIVGALSIIDRLAHTRDETELRRREILSQIQRPDLLRFALLLHHLENGAKSRNVARRMGLARNASEMVAFLVDNQDLLAELVDGSGREDDVTLEGVAERIGDTETLRMLYLLTYADSRAVGRLGWFAWRDARLYEVYNRLLAILEPEAEVTATHEAFTRDLMGLVRGTDRESSARRLLEIIPERYAVEVSPREAVDHLELIGQLESCPAAMDWSVQRHTARLWLCSSDVPSRFSQVTGVLTAHGLNVLNAHAFSLEDGTVLDRFIVHRHGAPINTDEAFWKEVESTLLDSVRGEVDLDALVAEKLRQDGHEPVESTRRGVTHIHFDNESSPDFTIVDLVTWDRMGLLYSVGQCLSEFDANIEFALVDTRLDVAEDVFYICDSQSGGPITDEKRIEQMKSALQRTAEGPEN
ncbi:MAG: hypothetical protein ACLFT2_01355 [Candidatus Brocadiia bacterium]